MGIITQGLMLVLLLASSLSMMICGEDHEVVAVVSVMLLGGFVDGEVVVNILLALASTRSGGVVVVGSLASS
jgi:hypothetical protein